MTPDQYVQLAREWGLPIVLFVVFVLTHSGPKRRWVNREELDDKQVELDGWKALYERERQDRIGAQKDVAEVASASARVAEQVERAMGVVTNPYDDRLQGRSRGR